MKLWNRWCQLLLLLVVVVGCGASTPQYAVQEATPAPAWAKRWLQGIPCAPPCWEGITPGQTSLDDAFLKIQALPEATAVSIMTICCSKRLLSWKWKNRRSGGDMQISETNVVEGIGVSLPGGVQFADILATYGEPDRFNARIIAIEGPGVYGFSVVYLSHGMQLSPAFTNLPTLPPRIDEHLWFDHIYFFSNEEQQFQGWDRWEGFAAAQEAFYKKQPAQ